MQQPHITKLMNQNLKTSLSINAKGKSKLPDVDDSPGLANMTRCFPQHMSGPYPEGHVANLNRKLVYALSAAENRRPQHLRALDKTKTLEQTIEALTIDNTALQASINLMELEKAQLQQQLSNMQGHLIPLQLKKTRQSQRQWQHHTQ